MFKERKIILFGEDLKKPIRLQIETAEKLSVAAVIFGSGSADIEATLDKKEGELNLLIVHISDEQPANIKISVRHAAPRTKSDVKMRSVLSGRAQTDLDGLIHIDRKADEAGARLFAEAMLFGNEARINFLPAMEVETKNVTASHGATIETADPEKYFYLGSRGLPENEIKHVLAESFISPLYELADEETAARVAEKIRSIL